MQIKVCGMRDPENILALSELEVQFMGLIFYAKSPRYIANDKLADWLRKQKTQLARIKRVGVFVNAGIEDVLNRVHDYELDFIQLHGSESPEYCQELKSFWQYSSLRSARIIKAFSVDEQFDFDDTRPYEAHCPFFLFDTKAGNQHGGTGQTFDWQRLAEYKGMIPYFLSGGLDVGMEETIRSLNFPQLYGVDLNSRFEQTPGVKDISKISQFLQNLSI